MAAYRKVPSGKWQGTVRLPGGKRVSRSHRLKGVVVAWAEALERDIETGKWGDPRSAQQTVSEWAVIYMPTRTVTPETLRLDHSVLRTHILPVFADHPLMSIKPSMVTTWLVAMERGGLSQATRRRAFNLLRHMLQAAVLDGILTNNPTANIEAPKAAKAHIRWFTREQVDQLLAQLPDPVATMTELMAWSGLRWGECAGLRVGDVDWLRRRISVTQAVTQGGRVKPYPKTDSSVREIPVPESVLYKLTPFAAGASKEDLLFRTRNNTPLSGNNWRRTYYAGIKAAGLPDWPPHTLRHTAASWLVQSGVSLYEVQALLGHASPAMTGLYAHLAPGKHDAVEGAWKQFEAADARLTLEAQ